MITNNKKELRRANAEAVEQRKEAMAEERKRVEAREQELLARRNSEQGKNGVVGQVGNGASNSANTSNQSAPMPPPPPMPELPPEDDGPSPLIYGRNANIKDPLLKIVDLSVDTGKVCIDGEIVNMGETRELKTGKVLIPFDVYDGSSTITCKIFAKPEDSKQIIKRLKEEIFKKLK